MDAQHFDIAGLVDRALQRASQNLTIDKLLDAAGLDAAHRTFDAAMDRLIELALANINVANLCALIGAGFGFADKSPQAIALGANLGDRRAHLEAAVDLLAPHVSGLRVSSLIETDPVDVPGEQPPYLNGAVVGVTTLEPRALLDVLMAIEARSDSTGAPMVSW